MKSILTICTFLLSLSVFANGADDIKALSKDRHVQSILKWDKLLRLEVLEDEQSTSKAKASKGWIFDTIRRAKEEGTPIQEVDLPPANTEDLTFYILETENCMGVIRLSKDIKTRAKCARDSKICVIRSVLRSKKIQVDSSDLNCG